MRRFSERFRATDAVQFAPAVLVTTAQGGEKTTYADTGTAVAASVQPRRVSRVEPDGTVRVVTIHVVYLLDDPAALNSGLGVRTDDAFLWRGLRLVAQGDAVPDGGRDFVWRADCLAVS